MKIFGSGRAVFLCRVILVCVIFVLTLAACISGALAVSGENVVSRYLPDVTETTVFKATLVAALAIAVALLFTFKNDRKGEQSSGEGEECEQSSGEREECEQSCGEREECEPPRYLFVMKLISRYISVLPAIVAFCVFYFALSDESLGSWGNAVMVTAFITALFFLFRMVESMRTWTVLFGFGVFAFGAVVIASLYLDHIIEINSDFKLLVQFGAAGVILGVMADTRRALSRISGRWFICLKSIGFILCSVCPAVIFSLPTIEGIEFPTCYSVYSWLYLACAVSFTLDMISELFTDRSRCR